jgi:hypothetical protein
VSAQPKRTSGGCRSLSTSNHALWQNFVVASSWAAVVAQVPVHELPELSHALINTIINLWPSQHGNSCACIAGRMRKLMAASSESPPLMTNICSCRKFLEPQTISSLRMGVCGVQGVRTCRWVEKRVHRKAKTRPTPAIFLLWVYKSKSNIWSKNGVCSA